MTNQGERPELQPLTEATGLAETRGVRDDSALAHARSYVQSRGLGDSSDIVWEALVSMVASGEVSAQAIAAVESQLGELNEGDRRAFVSQVDTLKQRLEI